MQAVRGTLAKLYNTALSDTNHSIFFHATNYNLRELQEACDRDLGTQH
ncbi:MAG: hypothetical protein F6K24_00065 [Okeania sp. SIO2D1]|nr:hypothetical protein [Okeania sp. SIO2D1]